MPGRIPTGNIPTPMVRKSSAAHPAVKPVENMKSKVAAKPMPTPSRIATGTDMAARKAYGKNSYNNGNTN